ncbi:MAG: glycosyltransferase family 25 protein [Janthinobacterium lividum]
MMSQLRDAALQARAAGNPAAAVAAWRAMLDHTPDDWTLALELKRDLKAGHHYPDSDPRFRRAARSLPDSAWLAHYAALYAFHGTDLAAIDARAWAILGTDPDPRAKALLWTIRGDVARQRRDWPGAATAFESALALCTPTLLASQLRLTQLCPNQAAEADPADAPVEATPIPQAANLADRAAEAHLYARLAGTPWLDHGRPYAISVLNLDRNPERMVEIERHFASSAAPRRRLPGVEGTRLSTPATFRLTGDRNAPRGTLGCFLSHAAAWEALLASDDPCALIVEDDVIPLLDLPARLGSLNLPATWDLVFVNDRMAPHPPQATAIFATTPLARAMARFPADHNAPGADGYLLSRRGAARLLDWTGTDGFLGDVDWRMLAYSLSPAGIAGTTGHARRELLRLAAELPRTARLDAHVLTPPLIRTVGVSSDREDVNRGE